MKIVITGGSGFLGKWLVAELKDHEVVVFDRMKHPTVNTYIGSIEDLSGCLAAFKGADAVIHTAALNSPIKSSPEEVYRVNTVGTFSVHEAARKLGIKKVISTSSEAAYGFFFKIRDLLPLYLPLDEKHPLRPQDCYGLSKKVGEEIAQSYADAYGMTTSIIRPPWIASPEDHEIHRGFKAGTAFPHGTFSTFAWVDVRDLAKAYRIVLERGTGYEIYNVCADDSTANESLSTLLPKINPLLPKIVGGWGSGLSNEKIKALGWSPVYNRSQFKK